MARRIIVAGTRTFDDYEKLKTTLDKIYPEPIEIVSGHALGADSLGEQYAAEKFYKLHVFAADWKKYGKAAGYLRNVEMGSFADELVAFWDGKSRGTGHMINIAREKQLKVHIEYFK